MEYAIVEIGGTQVWVQEGQYFVTNKISTTPGTNISLSRVLLINKNDELHLGYPYLKDKKVTGEIVEHFKGTKLIVYKMKSKKKRCCKQRKVCRTNNKERKMLKKCVA